MLGGGGCALMRRSRKLPIRRVRTDGSFIYERDGKRVRDPAVLGRIDSIRIPPAWENVEITTSRRAKVLARGEDAAGRTQAIYHPAWRRRRDREKFDRIARFGRALPKLRAHVQRDLQKRRLTRTKVVACIITLIDRHYFRVGSATAAREAGSFGISTLRRRHTTLGSTRASFEFVGKSGKLQRVTVRDRSLVRVLQQLHDMPGYEMFRFFDENGIIHNVDARHVNEYVKQHLGAEFSAKDFRTWGGTLLAFEELLEHDPAECRTQRERTRRRAAAVEVVAEKLGNTTAIAKSSYIDPRVLEVLEHPDEVARLRTARSVLRGRKHQSASERLLLQMLREHGLHHASHVRPGG